LSTAHGNNTPNYSAESTIGDFNTLNIERGITLLPLLFADISLDREPVDTH